MSLVNRLHRNAGFVIRNPAVLRRIAKSYFLKIFMGRTPLRTADISFDYVCNFKCKHCFTTDFVNPARKAMGLKDIKNVVDRCLREGAIHFNLIGGEPTMNNELFEVVDYIHAKGALISLATNGSLLSKDYVKKLKAHKLDLILVSMDYFDADLQNEFRGDGFFEGALAAVENCLGEGLPVYVSAVITKDKDGRKSFYALADFCEKKSILLHVNLPTLIGRWKGRDDLFLTEEDKKEVRTLYRKKFVSTCEMSSYFECACKSGQEKLHVTAYGDVLPCAFIPVSFGNILDEELSVIRRRILDSHFFKAHHELCIPSTDPEYFKLYKDQISPAPLLPVSYKAVTWP